MKRIFKRLYVISMLAIIMTAVMFPFASAESISSMSNDYFVQDNADVMVYNEVDKLADNARELHNEYNGLRLMIVTITKLDGETIENAATRIAKENSLNIEGRDILILLSIEDNMIHVLLGEEIKGYITIQKVNRIIKNYAVPDLEREQYTLGLMTLQTGMIREVKNSIQPGVEKNEISTTVTFTQNESIVTEDVFWGIGLLIIVLCIFAIFVSFSVI